MTLPDHTKILVTMPHTVKVTLVRANRTTPTTSLVALVAASPKSDLFPAKLALTLYF
jgi:hypothetical protein